MRRVVGRVEGCPVLVVDDMISTGGTVQAAIQALLAAGCAPEVTVARARRAGGRALADPAHPTTAGDRQRGGAGPSAVPVHGVSLAPLLAEAIRRLHQQQSPRGLLLHGSGRSAGAWASGVQPRGRLARGPQGWWRAHPQRQRGHGCRPPPWSSEERRWTMVIQRVEQLVHIFAEGVTLEGLLVIPAMAQGDGVVRPWQRQQPAQSTQYLCGTDPPARWLRHAAAQPRNPSGSGRLRPSL